jgi:hypothetical protein
LGENHRTSRVHGRNDQIQCKNNQYPTTDKNRKFISESCWYRARGREGRRRSILEESYLGRGAVHWDKKNFGGSDPKVRVIWLMGSLIGGSTATGPIQRLACRHWALQCWKLTSLLFQVNNQQFVQILCPRGFKDPQQCREILWRR